MDPTFRNKDWHYEIYERPRESLVEVEIYYPRNDPPRITTVEVGLSDVRAADSIRISYDFERDGWSVKQAAGWDMGWPAGTSDEQMDKDMDWQEVFFVQAWARVPKEEEKK